MGSLLNLSILKGEQRKLQPALLHKMLEDVAANNSDKIALLFNDANKLKKTTYDELNSETNKLARGILSKVTNQQIPPNRDGDYLIAVSMMPSDRLVTALLAIWKSGAAYLPLDPSFPSGRVKHILTESQPALIIYDENDDTEAFEGTLSISYEQLQREIQDLSKENLLQKECLSHARDDLAIVLYTSGSTGVPKGVRLPHKVLLNRLQWQWKAFPFSKTEDTAVFKTALTFVDSVSEIWSPLLNGLTVLVVSKAVTRDPARLVKVLTDYKIERLVLVPSLLRSLLLYLPLQKNQSALRSLKIWVCSGEPLAVSLAQEFFKYFSSENHILCNFYGSTEVMGDVTYFTCQSQEQLKGMEKVPIGYPLDNTIVYLLDSEHKPVKNGEVGELFVAGLNLAAGYVNGRDPDRFIENPLAVDPNYSRIYRTGDFARIEKGTLLYEGRTDSQIKIRGHRVDLSEVEKSVVASPGVEKGVVLCYKPGEIDQALLAFVTCHKDSTITGLQIESNLQDALAAYMIPQVIVMENIPLLVNGKIDRQTLLKSYENTNNNDDTSITFEFDYSGIPENLLTKAKVLFETIGNVIGRSTRGAFCKTSNFYELGGNSLNSIVTVTQLREQGYFIGITDFITAKDLGDILERLTTDESSELFDTKLTSSYSSEFLQDNHKDDSFEMITSSFYEKADLEQWLMPDIKTTDYTDLLEKIWKTLIEKRYSFVVKDQNDVTIGVAFNFDARDEPEVEIDSKLLIVFEFLEHIEGPVRDNQLPPGVGTVLHSFMMATASHLTAQENITVMQYMESEVLRLARDGQFTGIFTTNTSPLTQQLGTDVYGYTVMTDYQVNLYTAPDGSKPFGKAPDSQRAVVSWKPL